MRQKLFLIALLLLPLSVWSIGQNDGEFHNLVVFVRFADEPENAIDRDMTFYNQLYNDSSSTEVNSVFNYFRLSSYNRLRLKTTFVPHFLNNEKTVAIQSKYTRNYFRPNTIFNKDGYTDLDVNLRESRLVKEMAQKIDSLLPEGYVIQSRSAAVDNLTLVLSGESTTNNGVILWPHCATQIFNQTSIRNKNVGSYVILFDKGGSGDVDKKINTGVICHETFHAMGAPDLYVKDKTTINPMGDWDLMATNRTVAQGMSAYTQHRYGGWIEAPEEITTAGTYRLYPVSGDTPQQIYYKIQEPDKKEYFIVEYRKKAGAFDSNIWSSGLLVYRINDNVKGNVSSTGDQPQPYGQYIFRQNGTPTAVGNLPFAALSQETGRTRIASDANPYPFYTGGEKAKFEIKEIGSCGEYIEFHFNPDHYASEEMNSNGKITYRIENNNLWATATDTQLETLTVLNFQGIELITEQAAGNEVSANMSSLSSGVYFLKFVQVNGKVSIFKIMI